MVAHASWLTPEETSPDSENRVWDFFGDDADFVGESGSQVVDRDWEKSSRRYDSRRGYVLAPKENDDKKKDPCDEYRELKNQRSQLINNSNKREYQNPAGASEIWSGLSSIENTVVEIAAEQATFAANPGSQLGFIQQNITSIPDPNFAGVGTLDGLWDSWSPVRTTHAQGARESAIPGFPNFVVKAYQGDPNRGDVIGVVRPTESFGHYLDAVSFTLGGVTNVNTSFAFLEALCGE